MLLDFIISFKMFQRHILKIVLFMSKSTGLPTNVWYFSIYLHYKHVVKGQEQRESKDIFDVLKNPSRLFHLIFFWVSIKMYKNSKHIIRLRIVIIICVFILTVFLWKLAKKNISRKLFFSTFKQKTNKKLWEKP